MTSGNESPYGQKNLKGDTSEIRFQPGLGRRKADELQCFGHGKQYRREVQNWGKP